MNNWRIDSMPTLATSIKVLQKNLDILDWDWIDRDGTNAVVVNFKGTDSILIIKTPFGGNPRMDSSDGHFNNSDVIHHIGKMFPGAWIKLDTNDPSSQWTLAKNFA